MFDQQHDEILQLSLKALEEGALLEDVLRDLPPGYRNIEALDRLAEASRALGHPRMSYTRVQYRLKSIINTSRRQLETTTWLQSRAIPLAFSLGLVTIIILVSLFFAGSGIFLTDTGAILRDTHGVVEIASVANAEQWSFAKDGDRVTQGSQVRTYIDSSTTLVYPDGSRTVLGPASQITFSHISGREGFIQIRFLQEVGTSENQVVPFTNKNSHFIIETAAGEVTVHGTVFTVQIAPSGWTRVAVDAGVVTITRDQKTVPITPGQAVLADSEFELDEPLYEFSLQGRVKSKEGYIWNVEGVPFFIGDRTTLDTDTQIDDLVLVRGRILETGERLADIIELARNEEISSGFSGVVEEVSDSQWVINGKEVIVDAKTQIDPDLGIGDAVIVSFLVSSEGGWHALGVKPVEESKVELVVDKEPDATLSPTETAVPPLTGAFSQEPREDGVCNGKKQHPDAIKLAEKYTVPYEEIIGWFCQGFGFGEIDLAYELGVSSSRSVSEFFSLRTSGLGWGVIRKEYESEITTTPKPTHETKPTKEIKPTWEPKPTGEPKPTKEPKPATEPKPTRKPKPTKEPKGINNP